MCIIKDIQVKERNEITHASWQEQDFYCLTCKSQSEEERRQESELPAFSKGIAPTISEGVF